MQQFFRCKAEHPDAILFFRLGDFYEMFYEDAVEAAALLDIALTSRSKTPEGEKIPMAGVPHHAAAGYLARLLERGRKVAICEQMADPSTVKGVVPREVVRVVTPGLCLEPDALDARAHNYLAVVLRGQEGCHGVAALELSTAELRATVVADEALLLAELARLDPREVLLEDAGGELGRAIAAALPGACLAALPPSQEDPKRVLRRVLEGAADDAERDVEEVALRAAAVALAYAERAQPARPLRIGRLVPWETSSVVVLDEAAVRNLELVRTLSGDRRGSLLALLDESRTAMGARLLRRRLLGPLTEVAAIRRRHDVVEELLLDAPLRRRLRELLGEMSDLERLATRAELGVATPRDLGAVRETLRATGALLSLLAERDRELDDPLARAAPQDDASDLRALLEAALVDEPPVAANAGGILREGQSPALDELRRLSSSGKDVVLELERRERERTGISSLKIRFARVFGYTIEVTRANLGAVPPEYRRKQTIANGERYVTDELEELQARILSADERSKALEAELFAALRERLGAQAGRLRVLADRLAELDVHACLADVAHRHGYVRPVIDESLCLELVEARHPVVERLAAAGQFVPNDIALDAEGERLMIVTGPNMAGKSTVMRQAALAVVLAQAGSFVPAARARIGVVDRVYTRVGASDDLARGQSTFMVEMRETAAILRGATRRSLVILDEIGRGTSTYDGLAIAWAVAEHLHDAVGARAMFATHYHELCDLAQGRPGVVNRNVAAREHDGRVVFLHELVSGGANRSYGVAVARLAGVPEIVLARARAILGDLEEGAALPSGTPSRLRGVGPLRAPQLDLFAPTAEAGPPRRSEVEETLRQLDVDRLRPVDALVAIARLKAMLDDPGATDSKT